VGLTALDVGHRLRGMIVSVAGGNNDHLPSGGEVRLDDLGVVTDTVAECSTFARYNGEPIVAIAVTRAKGASDVVVVLSRPAGWPGCSRDPAQPLC
jgi:multidrug efflux pump subunit AcrB